MLLQWKGGKYQMAEWLIDRFPPHKRYIEVFFGGGHVFWQKGLSQENVINDLNSHLVNLYKVIQNPINVELLKIRLRNTIYSRELFNEYKEIYFDRDKFAFLPRIEKAYIYLYLNKVSFNGEFQHFASKADAGALYNIEEKINVIHNKLRAGNTVIENLHFRDLLGEDKSYIDKTTFLYLDPPYWITTQSQGSTYYEKVMKVEEHEELYKLLREIDKKGAKWLMSYDDVDVIRDIYSDFNVEKTPELHQSSATASGKSVFKSEIIISNFNSKVSGTLFGEE